LLICWACDVQEYASDRVIVSFKTDVVVAMAAEEEGLQFMRPAGQQGSVVYSITDGADVADKIKQLEHHPGRRAGHPCPLLGCCWRRACWAEGLRCDAQHRY
jgi:hypothetical protein